MNISLPDSMKSFVDEQVSKRGYGTSSEYVRELIRKDQERLGLRSLMLAGATSKPGKPALGLTSKCSGRVYSRQQSRHPKRRAPRHEGQACHPASAGRAGC